MLAPSGGVLILYQAYGNLYAMTGRKAHLLEDKQIPSVGVFDEVFSIWKAFGGNTRDLGSFREETDKTTDLHQHFSRLCSQRLETASQDTLDAVTIHSITVSQEALENQLLSVSLLICLGKHDCVERIPSGTDKTNIIGKPSKNGQTRIQEQKSVQEPEAKVKKVNLGQNSVNSVKPQKIQVTNLVPQAPKSYTNGP
ncbi:hypothetical protein Tco_0576689 [Tanacetum coccineum]